MPAMRNRVQGVQSRPPLSYGRGQGQARFRRQVYFGFSCAGHGHFRVNVRMRLSETRVLLSTWMSQKKRFRHAIVRRVPRNVRKQSHKKPLFLGHAGLHFPSGEVSLWVGIVTTDAGVACAEWLRCGSFFEERCFGRRWVGDTRRKFSRIGKKEWCHKVPFGRERVPKSAVSLVFPSPGILS